MSARALDRLCTSHDAYRWICGGVSVNYHTLSDFRTEHVEFLDHLLTVGVAALMNEGLVTLNRVAQDGVKVRASAGAASFRRKPTLAECLEEAQQQVDELKKELDEDPSSGTRREKAARERAAKEMKERIERALLQMPEVGAKKKAKDKEKARVSTTDPDARVMKMADGGFPPAYNGQFATDTQSEMSVGVDATNSGNDQGQLSPMNGQIHERYGKRPEASLVDDSPAVAAWRERMGTEQAKEIYRGTSRPAAGRCAALTAGCGGCGSAAARPLPHLDGYRSACCTIRP